MGQNMFKQMYIYIKFSEDVKGNPLDEVIGQLIKISEDNEENYAYWGYDERTGLNEKRYTKIKTNQDRLQVLFVYSSSNETRNRVYCVADVVGFECYNEKQYTKNPKLQMRNTKTNDIAKHKYWYKLNNFNFLTTEEERRDYDLSNFYYETEVSQKEGLNEEINLKEKLKTKEGKRNGTLIVHRYLHDCRNEGELESVNDIRLHQKILSYNLKKLTNPSYTNKPKLKGEAIKVANVKLFERDAKVAVNALVLAKYCCEVDCEHKTFKRKKDGLPYTEAHHLIPMKFSDDFEYSLDIEQNVISLCSHCHNQIHYGEDWEETLKVLYEKRKKKLESVGLKVSYEKLKEYYN